MAKPKRVLHAKFFRAIIVVVVVLSLSILISTVIGLVTSTMNKVLLIVVTSLIIVLALTFGFYKILLNKNIR